MTFGNDTRDLGANKDPTSSPGSEPTSVPPFTGVRRRLDSDVAANLFGRVLTAIIGFVFLPMFLRVLGAEGYGLVGFYTVLVGLISLFDFGLGLTLNREMARLGHEAEACQARRDTLRSLESAYGLFVVAIGLAVVFAAPSIVGHWLRTAKISRETVETSVRLMGVACVFQLVGALYQGALFGLQRQVTANTLMVAFTLLRQAASLAMLIHLGARVEAYFITQAAGFLAQAAISAWLVRKAIGPASKSPRFRWSILRDVRGYALGVSGAQILGTGMNQLDRVVASGVLPLGQFAYYSVAASLAGLLYSIVQPLNQAYFPKLTQTATSSHGRLAEVFRESTRTMTALLVPVAAVLATFSWEAIFFWTRNGEAADGGQIVARVLVIGVLLNGLASLLTTSLFAGGRSGVMLIVNAAFAVVLFPAAWIMAAAWGGPGAAMTSLLLNLGYLIVLPPLVRRVGLRSGWRRWLVDVSVPVVTATLVASLGKVLAPVSFDRRVIGVTLMASGVTTAAATWGVMWWMAAVRPKGTRETR